MKAEIITIGNELLDGKIRDSNAVFISNRLRSHGISILRITTVGDALPEIREALQSAFGRADLVVTTGGLGPTHDDVTVEAVADFLRCPLRLDVTTVRSIQNFFQRKGKPAAYSIAALPKQTQNFSGKSWESLFGRFHGIKQAYLPSKAAIIPNPFGTAPVLRFRKGRTTGFCLPGVPLEMQNLLVKEVLPRLKTQTKSHFLAETVIHTTGTGESFLASRLDNLSSIERVARVAFLPHPEGVDIRLTAEGRTRTEARGKVKTADRMVCGRLSGYVYGKNSDTLEAVVGKLLRKKGVTLAAAESCTGGLIASRITDVSGSSAYFLEGRVTYSNRAKQKFLGVPEKLLREFGAVSGQVARAMAEGVRKRSGADIGVSATGIAGPTGGTREKPVGLVYIGYADAEGSTVLEFRFTRDRAINKIKTSQAVLDLVRKKLQTRMRK